MLGATGGRIDDVERLVVGLTVAQDGASQLSSGTTTLSEQAACSPPRCARSASGVDALVPRITSGQTALRDATGAPGAAARARRSRRQSELESALAALDRAGAAGKADPAVQEARRHVALALQAASGRNADTGATGRRRLPRARRRRCSRSSSSRTSRARQVDDAVRRPRSSPTS